MITIIGIWARKYAAEILLIGLFFILLILSYKSEGTYGGSDDYGHYKFARYAFSHPELYLEHWAKPAFTFLASPFAQFGFMGIKIFNLIVGLFAGYITYRVCKIFNYKFSWLAIIMVCFAPAYLSMLLSGMTEILFSFTLILCVFLALRKNFLWSAIILSFLPFVRNEGITIFPVFILYYVIHKKYKVIPLLLSGFILISLAGAHYYKDVFWVITKMPYTGAKDIYGSGPLMHFVNASKDIFGIPLAIFGLTGIVFLVLEFIRLKYPKGWIRESREVDELLLVFGSFAAYYIAHSVLWWKGWGGSLGLIRVIAGVVPLFAILGMKGFSRIIPFSKKWLAIPLVAVASYLLISTPFKVLQIPVQLGPAEQLISVAGKWVHQTGLDKNRVYYYDPFYWFALDIDPYDQQKVWEVVPNRQTPSKDIPDNSVILWDAHYGPNEGKLKLETLMNDTFLTLKKVFRPLQPFTTLGGYNYELCIFQKTSFPNNISLKWENYRKTDSLNEISLKRFLFYDFETDNLLYKGFKRTDSMAYSGRLSCLISKQEEFGPTIVLSFKNLEYPGIYRASARLYSAREINWKSVFLVVSAEHKGKLYLYSTQNPIDNNEQWKQVKLSFNLPEPKSKDDLLKIYIWNKERQLFLMDDLALSH